MATLSRAELFTHTNDDNKDKDTGINISVMTADGATQLASCNNADSSNDDATEYNDGSDHTVVLDVNAPGATFEQGKKFTVHMSQQTHGNDTWKFNARVTLFFTDGTNLVASQDGVVLKTTAPRRTSQIHSGAGASADSPSILARSLACGPNTPAATVTAALWRSS
jgi:hypothetical protein